MKTNTASPVFRVAVRGEAILTNPRFNKGMGFTTEERKAFGLTGRLPSRVNTLDEQCERAYGQLLMRDTPIRKNSFLQSLKEQNWVLYYTLLRRHLRELTPVIYTPTEAEAISNYSHLFRRSEGLYLTFAGQDSMEEDFLEQTKGKDIDLIVCSDSEAILGIGDQGVGISAAKSVLYTVIGGINPSNTLAVVLDVGTNNEDLLNDPLYVGWPQKRVAGSAYDEFIDKFVQLVRKHFPHSLLHFEDFGVTNASRILKRYHDAHAVFNDDIQGTGAVTLSGIMAAIGVTKTKLADQRYIIYGAGSAGVGITIQLRDAIVQADGVSVEEANSKFYLVDKYGLLKTSLGEDKIRETQKPFVRTESEWEGDSQTSLVELIEKVKPTVLIGCSTHAGGFTEDVLRTLVKHCERPIVFPLSNPSRLVEVHPTDAMKWTDGKALIATGSPFEPVQLPDGSFYEIAECNNALIYPGLGFGALLSKSRLVTDSMILAGAQKLASLSPALHANNPSTALLPDFADAPEVNLEVAIAVAVRAAEEGSALEEWASSVKDDEGKVSVDLVRKKAEELVWKPIYGQYVYDLEGEK
ncbi:hypothetical protein BDN72DRAFT_768482 [Pluteus cervinus]|uniref:Uncharacterized protein n=1 Tax=Pluteus cervinus TaxID=181527 RepID=A0ACD3ATM5_9AGAR|nr:hypothetical protein BDN72DRAFT_768482 [Pluteus cervinus]